MFNRLREVKLYLSKNLKKIDIYSTEMDCLGFIVTDQGIQVDASKADKIAQWRTPRNYNDVQQFNGMIQYLSQFLKDVTVYTAPLTSMCKNGKEFVWSDLQERCFQELKQLVAEAPIIRPIDYKTGAPVWVVTDASARGVGGYYGQGPSWDTCRPAGFMSRKFTPAQINYATWEHELLAVLEALLRWEDKLFGLKFTIVTDHKALTFFKEAPYRTQRRMRWWEYLSRFQYSIEYIEGPTNKVADSLSRYYVSDEPEETHDVSEYVNADSRLDPDGDDLPIARTTELISMRAELRPRKERAREILERTESRDIEAKVLLDNREVLTSMQDVTKRPNVKNVLTVFERLYAEDQFFSQIWKNAERHNRFEKRQNLLWTVNRVNRASYAF